VDATVVSYLGPATGLTNLNILSRIGDAMLVKELVHLALLLEGVDLDASRAPTRKILLFWILIRFQGLNLAYIIRK
jgi:hypothetical protein